MVSCKELWRVVDQQPENFNDYWWDAYVLTHITWKYLKHAQLANPKAKTPFKKRNLNNSVHVEKDKTNDA